MTEYDLLAEAFPFEPPDPAKAVPHVSTCDACGAPIVWVFTEKNKSMSIDAEPGGDPDKARFRKERTEERDGKTVGIVHFVKDRELEANTRPLYCCHFDTCPDRKEPQQ
jgi:hypothetical protein